MESQSMLRDEPMDGLIYLEWYRDRRGMTMVRGRFTSCAVACILAGAGLHEE